MIQLKNVTLICVDCKTPIAGLKSLIHCSRDIKFFDTILITDQKIPADFKVKIIPSIKTLKQYSYFVVHELYRYCKSSHLLLCQHDGYIINSQKWNNQWLEYDYIGCLTKNWGTYHRGGKEGNGGFSLRSRRLLKYASSLKAENYHPEDCFFSAIDGYHNGRRLSFEERGFLFPDKTIISNFGIELHRPIDLQLLNTFGFHGGVSMRESK